MNIVPTTARARILSSILFNPQDVAKMFARFFPPLFTGGKKVAIPVVVPATIAGRCESVALNLATTTALDNLRFSWHLSPPRHSDCEQTIKFINGQLQKSPHYSLENCTLRSVCAGEIVHNGIDVLWFGHGNLSP